MRHLNIFQIFWLALGVITLVASLWHPNHLLSAVICGAMVGLSSDDTLTKQNEK